MKEFSVNFTRDQKSLIKLRSILKEKSFVESSDLTFVLNKNSKYLEKTSQGFDFLFTKLIQILFNN